MNKLISILSFITLLNIACNTSQKSKDNTDQEKIQETKIKTISKSITENDLKIPKIKTPILGIDVSHFQEDVDWKKVKEVGIHFCYAKATQGSTYKDPKFLENKLNTLKANLFHGAYHFYVAENDPKKQAHNFLSTLKITQKNKTLLPMLDLEQGGIKSKITDIENFQKDILIWLIEVENKLGVKPIIYTNNPFANTYLRNPKFSKYKLWLAEYGVKKPKIPITWKTQGWSIWQRSEKGLVNGIIGNVDHDILNPKHLIEDFILK